MLTDTHENSDGWRVIKRIIGPSTRDALSFVQNDLGLIKFRIEKWQRYYEPSPDDLAAPVEGGMWGWEESGLYPSLSDAEFDAVRSVVWFEVDDPI